MPPYPHDAFFRSLLVDPGWADALIRQCLPPDVAALLPGEAFAVFESSFVDDRLRISRADGVFSIRLEDGRDLYVLLEHKSAPDAGTPLQLAEYMLRIWRNHERRESGVPLIIPIVVYHGPTPCRGRSRSLPAGPGIRSATMSSTWSRRRIASFRLTITCAAVSGS